MVISSRSLDDHHLRPVVNPPGSDFHSPSPSSVTLSEILASLATSPPPRPVSVPESELSPGFISASPPLAPFPMMPGYFPMVAPVPRYEVIAGPGLVIPWGSARTISTPWV
ncbi:uncharacterized protein LOC135133539 isoform X1 [Zophobas morio]|uniref:uncharacterized protein LOC135133539 isoform X1 n=1 Tax=Zophobas morio TaxID=2755281 RepID=UPI0030830EA4